MKLMVLGGGNCQLNLIKKAKERGHEIILIDYLDDCPGLGYADKHIRISTFDSEEILQYAKKESIEGIVTLGTDQPVLSAAIVADELNLNFYIDKDTALQVTNKRVMKPIFEANNIPCVDYVLIDKDFENIQVEKISFPAVMKPVDSQGQKGIFLINDVEEIKENIETTLSFSREDKVLLEEYYSNDEITINGWVDDGEVTIISVVDRVTLSNENHIGICLCHNYPSLHYQKHKDDIKSITKKIVETLKIKNGPIYFQYLIGENGVLVNEIAMRIGGAYEDISIPIISNIDILDMLLTYIEEGDCNTNKLQGYDLNNNKLCVSNQLFFCKPGYVNYITSKEEILKLEFVHDVYYAIEEKVFLGDIENASARAGYFIVSGNSFDDMIKNVNIVFEVLRVEDENGENLVIKYEDYCDKYKFI